MHSGTLREEQGAFCANKPSAAAPGDARTAKWGFTGVFASACVCQADAKDGYSHAGESLNLWHSLSQHCWAGREFLIYSLVQSSSSWGWCIFSFTGCSPQLSPWPTSSPRWADLTQSCNTATHTGHALNLSMEMFPKCNRNARDENFPQTSKEAASVRAEWGTTGTSAMPQPSCSGQTGDPWLSLSPHMGSVSRAEQPSEQRISSQATCSPFTFCQKKKIERKTLNSVWWRT